MAALWSFLPLFLPSFVPSFRGIQYPRYPVLYLYCMYDVADVGASGRLEALLLHSTLPALQGLISEAVGAEAETAFGRGSWRCMCWAGDLHCTDMAESPVRLMIAARARLLRWS